MISKAVFLFKKLIKKIPNNSADIVEVAKEEAEAEAEDFHDIRFSIDLMPKGNVKDSLEFEGWVYSSSIINKLSVELNGCVVKEFNSDLVRPDVCSTFIEVNQTEKVGFKLKLPVEDAHFNNRGSTKIELFCFVGLRKRLLASSLVFHEVKYNKIKPAPADTFYFTVASSNISLGGFGDFKEKLSPFSIGNCQLGFMAPLLYMRSTLGAQHDWQFDPDFDSSSKQENNKLVIADSLTDILEFSKKLNVPCLIGLNGGVWSDASGSCPEWDLTDHLEEDINNCQWNQRDEVMPDDYLKHLTGAESAPELSRSLTLSHYNETVRAYKKRNLQQAGKAIAQFASEHPNLYIGSNLDPDCYQNPFFEGEQWYDFNPYALQQFRDWLAASGAYAHELKKTIKHAPFTLDSLNAYLETSFISWNDVSPPRDKICKSAEDEDKFLSLWEEFRRHTVQRHYSDLTDWLTEAGISNHVIYSSQGFTAPRFDFAPFALSLNSPVKDYDSGGMSLEGSKPDNGHVGAILYGESARNNIRTENQLSFFENILKLDSDWAVVEFNPADLRDPPKALPDYGFSWECLREVFNHKARLLNLMAWNGSTAHDIDKDYFNAHMALRDTPLEHAVIDFMLMYADVPRGDQCYTFGSQHYASLDGWCSKQGQLEATIRGLQLHLDNGGIDLCAPQPYLYGSTKSINIEFVGAIAQELKIILEVDCLALECRGQLQQQSVNGINLYQLVPIELLPMQMESLTLVITAPEIVKTMQINRIIFAR